MDMVGYFFDFISPVTVDVTWPASAACFIGAT